MKKIITLCSAIMLFMINAKASHLAGGEIRYDYNGSSYDITVTLYGDCAGISMPQSVTVNVASASSSSNANIVAQRVSNNIYTPHCGAGNKCTNPNSPIPGFRVAIYKVTQSIPAASDWVISLTTNARNSSNNISSNSGVFYIAASLNNANGPNSSPMQPANAPFYIAMNQTMTMPIQLVDADGDSITVDRVIPQTAANTNVTYNAGGYSATNPFGGTGTYSINTSNNTMTLKGVTQGNTVLAYRVNEFRNGVLIGTYMREFSVAVLPSTGPINYTFPTAASQNNNVAYACPGASGSETLTFTDPVNTETVTLTIDTPAIPGWNFNISTTNGTPTASTTISWTAPANLNPQTLPYFYIKIKAVDNGCPVAVSDYVMVVRTQQCPVDSVWPGDANSDKVANLTDALAIAIAYNQTGPQRPNASNNWTAQWAQNWANTYPFSTVNVKHGDCNGDGVINAADLIPLALNYGKIHPKHTPKAKLTGVPELRFDLSGITLTPGQQVSIPIKLGSTTDPINDFYGLATNITINGFTMTAPATINSSSTWLGNANEILEFKQDISNESADWVLSRNNHQNTSGSGTLAMLEFTVPASATPGQNVSISFTNTSLIDKDGNPITNYNAVDATIAVNVSDVENSLNNIMIVPNPSNDEAKLYTEFNEGRNLNIIITDMIGKTVYNNSHFVNGGSSYISLPTNVASGVYSVQISTNGLYPVQTMKWVKQ